MGLNITSVAGLRPPEMGQLPVRPDIFPKAVLWCREDASKDPLTKPPHGNSGRFKLHAITRNEHGSPLEEGSYLAIRTTAAREAQNLFTLPGVDPSAKLVHKYFIKNHPREYEQALIKLEIAAPCLQLCAG